MACEPCRGGVPPLADDAVGSLLVHVPAWSLREGPRIERRFTFKSYAEALAFISAVAVLAEDQQHHPDICFGWRYATVSLQTKAIKGLHRNDFILAAKIDALDGRRADVRGDKA